MDEHIISTMGRHLRMALGAEQAIVGERLSRIFRRLVMVSFAGLAFVCGIVALNMACFFALTSLLSPVLAMLAVGLLDLLLASIIMVIAAIGARDRRVCAAEDIRTHAYEAIDLDLKLASYDLAGLARHPFEPLILPALSLLASWLMRIFQGRSDATR